MHQADEKRLHEEIKRLKEALDEEKRKLSVVLHSMVDGVYTTDASRRITFWNDGAVRITGFRREDVLGRTCRDILAHTDEAGNSLCDASCPLTETMGKRKAISGKNVFSGSAGGRVIPVSVSCSPIVGPDNGVIGAIEVFRDISEQKDLERQKADFYSMITHDLKSPLQVIMGYSELLLEKGSEISKKDADEFIAAILKNGERLLHMLDEFLSVSLVGSRSMPINPAPADLTPFLESLYGNYLPIASKKGVRLELSLQGPLPQVMLDAGLMERALSNLLTNAFKFTPGGGRVTLAARSLGDAVEISVSDTGPGISEEEQASVFDMYYRTQASRGIDGAGLGLAIVKAVAEAHGGSVTVNSRPGEGSVFIMRLPSKAAGADGPRA